jgi:Domain of unknown function (DUF4384)
MRKVSAFLTLTAFLAALGVLGVVHPLAQEQEEDVRGAFLTTRPKPMEKGSLSATPARPSRKKPKTPTGPKATTKTDESPSSSAKPEGAVTPKIRVPKIGLGLTLFARDSNGLAVRTDPTRVFRSGDRVRVLIETNADGYLYIFNTTDGGKPMMIYPSAELDEGGNYIQSHVPFEIPSAVGEVERLKWLTFDKHAGAERLFFVFTREPLKAVPTEDDLIKFCQENAADCPIQPNADLWAQIQGESNAPLQVTKAQNYGRAQTSSEHLASTRGIGLSSDDPEPSLVMMTSSTNTAMLVAVLELIHK